MSTLAEGQQWQTPSLEPSPTLEMHRAAVAFIRSIDSGWIHYRYRDETTSGMFSGNDSDLVDVFRRRFPIPYTGQP